MDEILAEAFAGVKLVDVTNVVKMIKDYADYPFYFDEYDKPDSISLAWHTETPHGPFQWRQPRGGDARGHDAGRPAGRWARDLGDAGEPGAHDHFELSTDRGVLRLTDPRRFGAVVWGEAMDAGMPGKLLAGLGREPFDEVLTAEVFHAGLRGRQVAIKQALLAGDIVVGAGNIYACEALFRAGIAPRRAARAVPRGKLPALHAAGLVDAVDAFCEHLAFSPAQVARVFDAAQRQGLPVLRLLARIGWHLRLRQLPRTVLVLGALVAAITALIVVPTDFTIEGKGELRHEDLTSPRQHALLTSRKALVLVANR